MINDLGVKKRPVVTVEQATKVTVDAVTKDNTDVKPSEQISLDTAPLVPTSKFTSSLA